MSVTEENKRTDQLVESINIIVVPMSVVRTGAVTIDTGSRPTTDSHHPVATPIPARDRTLVADTQRHVAKTMATMRPVCHMSHQTTIPVGANWIYRIVTEIDSVSRRKKAAPITAAHTVHIAAGIELAYHCKKLDVINGDQQPKAAAHLPIANTVHAVIGKTWRFVALKVKTTLTNI